MMKAIIQTQYGGPEVLKLAEVAMPQVGPQDVLIKVKASSITTADSMMMTGKPYVGRLLLGLTKPKHPITGTGFAGVVEAVGAEVTQYQPGDAVYGESVKTFGAQAEYLCLPEDELFLPKPSEISFEEAAVVSDGLITSMNFLRKVAQLKAGQRVLINGAAGSLGSAAVQLAVQDGAIVTAVCSTRNIEFVKSLGAHEVIDYTREDFTHRRAAFDVIYDTVGKSSFSAAQQSLTPQGVYVSPVLGKALIGDMLKTSLFGKKKAKFSATGALPASELKALQKQATELLATGKVKPHVSRRFRLEEFQEAHQHIASGHKRANIVFTLNA
jgi:NADPH:quinone reductase-like Zn-dependent oxidoreductase